MAARTPPARRPGPATPARRGSTLLEVVLAAVLLAGVALAIFSTLGFLQRSEDRRERTAAAYEVASRLLLQYLDDKSQMPSESEPIADGGGRYRFRFTVRPEPVTIESAASTDGGQMLNQTTLVRATVYRGVDAGPAGIQPGEQLAQLTRLYNPMLLLLRSEDARNRALSRPEFFEELQRGGSSRGSGTAGTGSSGPPRGPTRATTPPASKGARP